MKHVVISFLLGSLLLTGLVCEVQAKAAKKPKPAATKSTKSAPAAPAA